jgi:hypothetical protein
LNLFAVAAVFILIIHLAWILWVVFGAFFTRGHPLLTALHVSSLVWGIIVETDLTSCPLTLTEQYLLSHAGLHQVQSSFLVHYLDRIVYPDLPEMLVVIAGITICAINLSIYIWRLWKSVHTR